MQMFYSPSTGGFYDSSYEYIPEDRIQISEEYHAYLLTGFEVGKVISVQDGIPVLIMPELTKTQLENLERIWRDNELSISDIALFKVQDQAPDAVGTVAEWRTYRNKLREWPEAEGFPFSKNRPKFRG
jgi:uncharacterized protein YbaR (Trm112 family)